MGPGSGFEPPLCRLTKAVPYLLGDPGTARLLMPGVALARLWAAVWLRTAATGTALVLAAVVEAIEVGSLHPALTFL